MAAQEPKEKEIALEADKARVRKYIFRLERINTTLNELFKAKKLIDTSIKATVPIRSKKQPHSSDLDVPEEIKSLSIPVSFASLSSIPNVLDKMIADVFVHSLPLNPDDQSSVFQLDGGPYAPSSIDFTEAVLKAYETYYSLNSDPQEGLATKVAARVCSFFSIKPDLPDLSWLPSEFSHFLEVQDGKDSRYPGYDTAQTELKNGSKKTHWIWYVFPQIQGLGRTETSKKYAIRDLEQACRYLQHPTLFERYNTLIEIIKKKLEGGKSLIDLFGTQLDAGKFISSITLFKQALEKLLETQKYEKPASLLGEINKIFNMGYPPCEGTIKKLGEQLPAQTRLESSPSFFPKSGSPAPSSSSSGGEKKVEVNLLLKL